MLDVKKIEELDNVLSSNEKCVVKIGTETCGPCKLVKQNLEKIEGGYSDVKFIDVDADECEPEIIDKFNIRNIPVVLFIKSGDVINRTSGVRTESQLKEDIKTLE